MKPETESRLLATLETLSSKPDRIPEVLDRIEDLSSKVLTQATTCPLKHQLIDQRIDVLAADVLTLKKIERNTVDTEITQARDAKKHWTRFSLDKIVTFALAIALALSGWIYALVKVAFAAKGHPLP